jgi:hypothetical protein
MTFLDNDTIKLLIFVILYFIGCLFSFSVFLTYNYHTYEKITWKDFKELMMMSLVWVVTLPIGIFMFLISYINFPNDWDIILKKPTKEERFEKDLDNLLK